jgi:phospholipid/cholesterol/gamma-HCH transport system substrate-binding protein
MKGRSQRIRLGIFILISTGLLLILIGFFTARRLFEKTDTYYIAYREVSVSGLEVGSPVKYLGITVGSISDIRIDPADVNSIIVKISLKSGTPIKEDASADILSLGITGLKAIEIRGGTNEAYFLAPEQFIRQGTSLVDDISGKAEVIAYKVEEVMNNLLMFTQEQNLQKIIDAADNISELAVNASQTFTSFDEVLVENRTGIRKTIESFSTVSLMLELTSEEIYLAMGKFNQIMHGDTLEDVLGNLRDISLTLRQSNLSELIENLAGTAYQTHNLLIRLDSDLERGSKDFADNLNILRQTMENINEVSRRVSTDPSILIRGQRARNTPDTKLQ